MYPAMYPVCIKHMRRLSCQSYSSQLPTDNRSSRRAISPLNLSVEYSEHPFSAANCFEFCSNSKVVFLVANRCLVRISRRLLATFSPIASVWIEALLWTKSKHPKRRALAKRSPLNQRSLSNRSIYEASACCSIYSIYSVCFIFNLISSVCFSHSTYQFVWFTFDFARSLSVESFLRWILFLPEV